MIHNQLLNQERKRLSTKAAETFPLCHLMWWKVPRMMKFWSSCSMPQRHRSIITSSNPVGIQNNVTFIVDLDSLGDPEDLLSDDLGAWEQTKTRSKWHLVKFKTNGEVWCDKSRRQIGWQLSSLPQTLHQQKLYKCSYNCRQCYPSWWSPSQPCVC